MSTPTGWHAPGDRFGYGKESVVAVLKASPESWTPLQQHELEWLVEDHHKRWDVSSVELGVSLHAMRELGHWKPFSDGFLDRRAKQYAKAIGPYVPPKIVRVDKVDVLDRITNLGVEICLKTQDPDIRRMAFNLLHEVDNVRI